MAFVLGSSAFVPNGNIPAQYTCEGKNISPPLAWTDPPKGTKSFVLIVDDPDAPDPAAPKMTWVHWLLFNIPPDTKALAEGVVVLPETTQEGTNDFKKGGYGGPCPPIGKHRYFHKIYALDTKLDLRMPTKAQLEKAMQGHILGQSELIGTYQKKPR